MKPLEEAGRVYHAMEVPPELDFKVRLAIARGEKKMKNRWKKQAASTAAVFCVLFVGMLNTSSVFAQAVANVPVLGGIARVFTFRQYAIEDESKIITVNVPSIADTGNTELETRVNHEVQARVDNIVTRAKQEARGQYDAFMATGGASPDMLRAVPSEGAVPEGEGTPEKMSLEGEDGVMAASERAPVQEGFMPVIVDVNYEVKTSTPEILSFVINKTTTMASAFTEQYYYNLDLKTGKDITLEDKLGSDYVRICNEQVAKLIEERMAADPEGYPYFDGKDGMPKFEGIAESQNFYLDANGNVVLCFEKYTVGPGFMGIQEFPIQAE